MPAKPDKRSNHPPHARPGQRPPPPKVTDWSDISAWYDALVGNEGSEYHREVVLPGVVRLLKATPGQRVLDVACGQGVLCRWLMQQGVRTTGVDAAPDLIAAAKAHGLAADGGEGDFFVADARDLSGVERSAYDAAACVLAIQNIHPIAGVFTGVAAALKPGGRFVIAMMHPAFRGPKESHWGWDEATKAQFRRVDRYLLPRKIPITAHPGDKASAYTWSFHKPLEHYVKAAARAGLLIDAIEEWPSHKTSQPGPRQAAENQARKEIPMFMAIRCVKVLPPSSEPEDLPE